VEDFDRLMAVNARSTFLCYKYAARQMIAQDRGGGRIIGAEDFFSFFSPWHLLMCEDVQGHVRQEANKVVSYDLNL
jgi:hypothetical protein